MIDRVKKLRGTGGALCLGAYGPLVGPGGGGGSYKRFNEGIFRVDVQDGSLCRELALTLCMEYGHFL